MITVKREIKYFIVFIMFVIAFVIALNKSQFAHSFRSAEPEYDFREFETTYNKKMNFTKIKLLYEVNNKQTITQQINELLNKYDLEMLNRDDQESYSVSLIEFPKDIFLEVMEELRKIEGLQEEKVETSSYENYIIDVEENLENKELLKETIQNELGKKFGLNPERVREYNSMLNRVQTQIDSLKGQKEIIKKNKNNNLLMLQIVKKGDSGINLSLILSRFWDLLKYMIILLIIFSIILVILYLFMDLTMRLLKIMGVKTPHGSGKYNYNSGYGRKVKRVYKDKHSKHRNSKGD
ncbi:MAG: hypothetical protein SVM86_07170 [Candidatus Cloacimonadota bacterium]|nr:hypothetical protein [Candidatus Cloacimonadota bacterium]